MPKLALPRFVYPCLKSSHRRSSGLLSLGPKHAYACLLLLSALFPAICSATPTITVQPESQTIFYGDPAIFRVTATSADSLQYRWLRNGGVIPRATNASYTITAVSENDDSARFTVVISDTTGSVTSSVAVLTVDLGIPGTPQTTRLFSYEDPWSYNQTEDLGGVNWMDPAFSDAAWPTGPGLLAAENNSNIQPLIGTYLESPQDFSGRAEYFRTRLFLTNDFSSMRVRLRCDDGGIIYVNGQEALRLRMPSGPIDSYTFTTGFPPDIGSGTDAGVDEIFDFAPADWGFKAGENTIAVAVHQANSGSSDLVWGMAVDGVTYSRLRDTNAPTLAEVLPAPGSTVSSFSQVEVHFSEGVKNLKASDLLLNSSPATNLTIYGPTVYVFDFASAPTGQVQVTWSTAQSVVDLSANSNRFAAPTAWNYTVDPSAIVSTVQITEFVAANATGIRDEDGHRSDWIELFNSDDKPVSLGRWYLTDDPAKLNKWQFPVGVSIAARSYLLVWATGLDRTNAAAPLHTSFKLDKDAGHFLALVHSDGKTVLSSFVNYPQQYDDIAYGRDRLDPQITGYFASPTPRQANSTLGSGFAPEVKFSISSGTFRAPFALTLSTDDPGAVIHYVVASNGTDAQILNIPNESSPVYTGPITISGTAQVRARAFPSKAGMLPGPAHYETYLQLADDVAGFTSDLPIVVFHNMGAGGDVPASADQFVAIQAFDTRNGRSSLLNPPDLATHGYFHRRGQATFWNPKANLRVETQNAYGDDRQVEFLGLPAESDWVFYGINDFDKVLMHNTLTHDLYRQMGHYSSNTRYVEVYIKLGTGTAGPVTRGDYYGLYVLEEKIKVGKNRVDIDKLQPENTNAPAVTGGYLLSIDKSNPGNPMYVADASIWNLDPDYYEITDPARSAQNQYIRQYFSDFYSALTGPKWTDPVLGYRAYIDMPSWVDAHLHNTFVFNVDMLRISSYFYKPRGGKIVQGPIWDFDRAFADSNDGRGFNPLRWQSGDGDGGTDPFNPGGTFNNPWYSVMFQDPDFWQLWIDRYQELRKSVYSLSNLYSRIDFYANQVREATTREYARWGATQPRSGFYYADGLGYTFPNPGTWNGEVEFVKYWFSNRVAFIDSNFLNPPSFSSPGGNISSGFKLNITASTVEPNSTIYYTLDGTDPRLPGGAVSPKALSSQNTASITLNQNARVFARNFNSNHQNLTGPNNPPISSPWSGPTTATFIVERPSLAITELMYNPARASSVTNNDDLEFIELKNTGTKTLSLLGFRFTNGIDFTFSATNAINSLQPGAYLVLVRNAAAFKLQYPDVTNVAGEYSGRLNNAGDHLWLEGSVQEPVADLRFNNTWYPVTDGAGFSLVPVNEATDPAQLSTASAWRPSSQPGGSPGAADPQPTNILPVYITEALTHTDPPQVDTVELFNPNTVAVDVSGWFLSDEQSSPNKYQLPQGSTIAPGAFMLVSEDQFNQGGTGFALSSLGDSIYLFSADGTNLTGFRSGFSFGPQFNGATFGRHVDSTGKEHFVTERQNSLGAVNSGPKVGPVVLNEIMYAPPPFGTGPDTVDEYVELRNVSPVEAALYDTLHQTNTWKLDGAVQFNFKEGQTIPAFGYLVVVGFDPEQDPASLQWFRSHYGLASSVPVVGPFEGHLANEGEHLGLYAPDNPQVAPDPNAGFVPYVLLDDVHYSHSTPWPTDTWNTGKSLQRIASGGFADDPVNWQSGTPSPGAINSGVPNLDSDGDGIADEAEIASGTNPLDPTDYLRFESVQPSTATGCLLSFVARTGITYVIEKRDGLAPSDTWTVLKDNISGNGAVYTVADSATGSSRFYRLRVTR